MSTIIGSGQPQRENHGRLAAHIPWTFRKEAFRWFGSTPTAANAHSIGTDLRAWLLREGELTYFLTRDASRITAYTNPYTYGTSTLALILANVVNAASEFSKSQSPIEPDDAEIARVRLYSELVLYTTRVCEGAIKQLLYCTGIPERYYERASLGGLLRVECVSCKKAGSARHDISLLGSLAHRYNLCIPIEQCLAEHMRLAGRRRNLEAAHSGVSHFDPVDALSSRRRMAEELSDLGGECIHMMTHVRDLEHRMLDELEGAARAGTHSEWWTKGRTLEDGGHAESGDGDHVPENE